MGATRQLRNIPVACAFVAALLLPNTARATTITGTITDWTIGYGAQTVPPSGTEQVTFFGSACWIDCVYLYGSSWFGLPNDWGIATGVTDVSQITDASIFPLTSGSGTVYLGQFVVARNANGYWAVMTFSNIRMYPNGPNNFPTALVDAQWWFQDNGTSNFAPVPEPAGLLLLGTGLASIALVLRRRRYPSA